MSKIYLVALEVNLQKYLKIVKGNRKAAMMEGALGALGIKKKFRKLKVEKLLSSWTILRNILVRHGSSFAAETFYATLLPDALHIKGSAATSINNSFVFSALNGRKNEFERFLPAPQSPEQKDRAADMATSLGVAEKIEIGVMAFFYDCESEIEKILLESRNAVGLKHGEIHIFEYCEDKCIYPSFINIDTGKLDGFIAGNINSKMEMRGIRSSIVSLAEKFLVAHRSKSIAPINIINSWLPAANLPAAKRRAPQKTHEPSALDLKVQKQKAKPKQKTSSGTAKHLDYNDIANRLVNATLWMARKEDEIEAGNVFNNTLNEWITEARIEAYDLSSLPGEYKSKLVEALISHPDLNNGYDIYGGVARIEAEIYDNIQSDIGFAKAYPSVIQKIETWASRLT